MAIERFSGFRPPIAELFALANEPFQPPAFRHACEKIATFEPDSSDDAQWRFSFAGGPTLLVALDAEPTGRKLPNGWPEFRPLTVSCAILSLCWWETFVKSEHVHVQTWEREREDFDRCFSDSLERTIGILGAPQVEGSDADENRYHYAIWRGKTGLLILQQSGYDPQFGYDVNYWVQPWRGPIPHMATPFIDWLTQQSSENDATL